MRIPRVPTTHRHPTAGTGRPRPTDADDMYIKAGQRPIVVRLVMIENESKDYGKTGQVVLSGAR